MLSATPASHTTVEYITKTGHAGILSHTGTRLLFHRGNGFLHFKTILYFYLGTLFVIVKPWLRLPLSMKSTSETSAHVEISLHRIRPWEEILRLLIVEHVSLICRLLCYQPSHHKGLTKYQDHELHGLHCVKEICPLTLSTNQLHWTWGILSCKCKHVDKIASAL